MADKPTPWPDPETYIAPHPDDDVYLDDERIEPYIDPDENLKPVAAAAALVAVALLVQIATLLFPVLT